MIANHYEPLMKNHQRRTRRLLRCLAGWETRINNAPDLVLNDITSDSMDLFVPEYMLLGPTPLAKLCLKRAQQASTAHFQLLMQAGNPVEIELDDQKMSIVGANRRFRTNANYWFKTIALAIIQRNRVAINSLCQVTDELHNTDEVGSDEFDNELARVYKVIFAGGNLAEQMVKAAALFVPDSFDKDRFIYTSQILWPQVSILRTIFTGDAEAEFNQKMEEALLLSRKYWLETSSTHWEGS
ncbi:MAG: immunity 49 family protein, partial [Anaerolineae bacterium]|nr:immunity 49 family protein [Anaerolineae bacterium]